MGVCGICSPGQLLVPVTVGDLLVPMLPSLLLLLRALLLLSRHLLLSPTLSVESGGVFSLMDDEQSRSSYCSSL